MAQKPDFSAILERERNRQRAAETLAGIAVDYPDLFEEFARAYLEMARQDKGPSGRSSVATRTQDNAETVREYLRSCGNQAKTLAEIADGTELTRSAVRHIVETTHETEFESVPNPHARGNLWRLATGSKADEPENRPLSGAPSVVSGGFKVGATQAVRQYLTERAESCTAREIVEAVLPHIETSSDDPTNLIHGTLANLERRGEVEGEMTAGRKLYRMKNGVAHE